MRTLLTVVTLALAPSMLSAQIIDNIGHRRHTHRHNDKHERVIDASRFHTNREGRQIELAAEDDAFTFIVYGDRTGGPDAGVTVLADAVRDTNLLEPDFVMTVGDLIQGYSGVEPWMREMKEFRGIMDELICPWFPVAGNHDVYWRGPNKPAEEHERRYEMHFGPLWYAFEHKNCLFIVLYTDEGNPETGERAISKPECQTMSPEQLAWLEEALQIAETKDLRHVFCFLHHPRWIGNQYGDDWEKVHKVLAASGRVRACFAGHIHRMRYDPKDGIEYVTLATVGAHQRGTVPSAGYLHQFHTVTVRDSQIAISAQPVGEVMDVREITAEMQQEMVQLGEYPPKMTGTILVERDGGASSSVETVIRNPTSRPIDVMLSPRSDDSRWLFDPDHVHDRIEAGGERAFSFRASRRPSAIDDTFRLPELLVGADYLTRGSRYQLPEGAFDMPAQLEFMPIPPRPVEEMVATFDGRDDCFIVPPALLDVPQGPMTLECWFKARSYNGRIGLVTKTESSEYGIFVSGGRPYFSIHLNGRYVEAGSDEPILESGRWYHVAGVYDGAEVRLYLDGERIATKPGSGERRTNDLPFIVGADVRQDGKAMSFFRGEIDGVRISRGTRYTDDFVPARRESSDDRTLLLLNMDGAIGPWLYDEAGDARPRMRGNPKLVPSS